MCPHKRKRPGRTRVGNLQSGTRAPPPPGTESASLQGSPASQTVRNTFVCLSFKPPGLWDFVMAASANYCCPHNISRCILEGGSALIEKGFCLRMENLRVNACFLTPQQETVKCKSTDFLKSELSVLPISMNINLTQQSD